MGAAVPPGQRGGTGNDALVSCLGDPQRAVAAHRELLRRDSAAVDAIRAGLGHRTRPSARAAAGSWTIWSTASPWGS
ncbi:hypothetical protein O1M54_48215 [Streptomyces diastatochromogenes]|nr:hypothetical protein [Streptomyces diastatochromogenes]